MRRIPWLHHSDALAGTGWPAHLIKAILEQLVDDTLKARTPPPRRNNGPRWPTIDAQRRETQRKGKAPQTINVINNRPRMYRSALEQARPKLLDQIPSTQRSGTGVHVDAVHKELCATAALRVRQDVYRPNTPDSRVIECICVPSTPGSYRIMTCSRSAGTARSGITRCEGLVDQGRAGAN